MASESYQRQLQSPKWQRKRLEILQRDNFTCIRCGETEKELHVHHRYYSQGKKSWEYPNECYETLCYTCHESVEHGLEFEARNTISHLRKLGATGMDMMDINVGICMFKDCHELIDWIHAWGIVLTLKEFGVDVKELMREKLRENGFDEA